ncbi:sugar phosphate nucleotidyltransferase [Petrachloros mirabilis]
MKVVLFCGGLGLRLREHNGNIPKPLVKIGYRPILWHIMKYYAHYGHKDFVLCLGYKSDAIKDYFLSYSEYVSNDFVLSNGGKDLRLLSSDISDWRISFVDTGLNSSVGERLVAVREHVGDEDYFLANYTDGVTNLDLDAMITYAKQRDKVACFLAVHPNVSFHTVNVADNGRVADIRSAQEANMRINGGFFILKKEIFDYIRPGEDLVEAPFRRLIEDSQLIAYPHDGFWACMDTYKEKQLLDDIYNSDTAPWEVWKNRALPSRKSEDMTPVQ